MTKYLIIGLVISILITGFFVLIKQKPTNTPIPSIKPQSSSNTRTTIPDPSIPPIEDINTYQTQTDKNYADLLKQQEEKYPWLQQFPLESPDYFVYFESQPNRFTAQIYPKSQSNISIENQTNQIKESVLQKLKSLNINISDYNLKWEVQTK